MSLPALKAQYEPTCPITDANRLESARVRQSIRKTLSQSIDLKDLAYEAAMSLKGMADDTESADKARSRAMAVSATIKAFKDMTDVVRITRGKALPVAARPEPRKPSKAVAFNPFKEQ